MSRPVKELVMKSYRNRFGNEEGAVLVSLSGMPSNDTNKLRWELSEKNIRVTMVKNTLAGLAAKGTHLEGIDQVLDGPCVLAYGGESVVDLAREMLKVAKTYPKMQLKGAVLEKSIFKDEDGIKRLSEFPSKAEAIGKVVGAILGPGATLAAALLGPGKTLAGALAGPAGNLAALVKAVEAKQKEAEGA